MGELLAPFKQHRQRAVCDVGTQESYLCYVIAAFGDLVDNGV